MKYRSVLRTDAVTRLSIEEARENGHIETSGNLGSVLHAYDSDHRLWESIALEDDDVILQTVDGDLIVMDTATFESRFDQLPDHDKFIFEKYVDQAGEHRYRLKSSNGQVVLVPGEGYKNEQTMGHVMESFIEAVRENRLLIESAD